MLNIGADNRSTPTRESAKANFKQIEKDNVDETVYNTLGAHATIRYGKRCDVYGQRALGVQRITTHWAN